MDKGGMAQLHLSVMRKRKAGGDNDVTAGGARHG